ncbi:homoserine dehydrogenase [Thermosyntropha sp.]|uniref:homoserine dehydrogenase n=1 Tax=Thermosyntropha sp. TaxID=2740820 RepID=UPI0025ED1482|nr:homoserine dehydrogenase [Thermosyntropha sp.]MBO8159565.1 homoserine dehydrogenase [Thermosyntropha sp.]
MIRIGLLGCGTVGSGVVKLLEQNKDIIANRAGETVVLHKVLERDVEKCYQLGIPAEKIAQDIDDILNDEEIDIVVELIGGLEPAFSYVIGAINRGKHVVSANKDLIAVKGREIFKAAEENNVDFYYEASVGGGIPIIYPLKQSLAANRIKEVIGILNGTTNYMLTKMTREGLSYEQVLKEAQELGYAEADPTSDVEGLDAARKIAILSSIAFNSRITLDDVYVEGITGITPADINYAAELGYVIKLLAVAKQDDEGNVEVRVNPAFIPVSHPLAGVNDVFNAVFVKGDAVGDVMHYGKGAGQMPTASAVVGDIIEIVRNMRCGSNGRIGCTCYDEKRVLKVDDMKARFYIRMTVVDRPGVLAGIAGVFGNNNVSIAAVLQKEGEDMAELILITHEVRERDLRKSLDEVKTLDTVGSINNIIRLEGLDKQ